MESRARFEHVEPYRTSRIRADGDFDRLAFAMRVLGVLRPRRVKVAVYRRLRELEVERGADLAHEGASWALVGIPPDASREQIAYALVELAGLERSPFLVDALVAHASRERD
ncbi:MAG: hypothetical protein OZ921_12995 [Sorangiineae bacterium]|nr:hypothetical protein [Polyangiaceae bacterium]MEB2323425.1 hypothetical protein [Sorangiineae bacterium]